MRGGSFLCDLIQQHHCLGSRLPNISKKGRVAGEDLLRWVRQQWPSSPQRWGFFNTAIGNKEKSIKNLRTESVLARGRSDYVFGAGKRTTNLIGKSRDKKERKEGSLAKEKQHYG